MFAYSISEKDIGLTSNRFRMYAVCKNMPVWNGNGNACLKLLERLYEYLTLSSFIAVMEAAEVERGDGGRGRVWSCARRDDTAHVIGTDGE